MRWLRGDLKGHSLRDFDAWSGQLYARVDAARFDTWGLWVPWAQGAVRRGTGSLRFWVELGRGQVHALTGDTRLEGVAVNVSSAQRLAAFSQASSEAGEGEAKAEAVLPDLAFEHLAGRIGWVRDPTSQTYSVENLRFVLAGEAPSEPASVRVTLTPDGKGGFKTIAANAKNLRLEALTALSGALPLPRRGHDLIEALNPRGLVETAEGHWGSARDYGFKLRLRDVGIRSASAGSRRGRPGTAVRRACICLWNKPISRALI